MSLLQRASTIFKAKASKVLDNMEDPRETLDYSYEKQVEYLQKVKRGLADVVTSKKQIELQIAELDSKAQRLDDEAKSALAQGREDLATQALERKQALIQQSAALKPQVEQLGQEEQKMTEAAKRLEIKIQSFRAQKEVIKAQYTSAQAQVKIGEAATGISEEMADVGMAVDRARDKTQQMRARAAAVDELTEAGALTDITDTSQDSLERELNQVNTKSAVAQDLERLKAEMAKGGTP